MFLKGNVSGLIRNLKQKMKFYSKEECFEDALEMRDTISALDSLSQRQRTELDKQFNQDVINFIVTDNKVCLVVFNVYKGMLLNKQEFEFEYSKDFFEEFISRYYDSSLVPRELIVPKKIDDSVVDYLNYQRRQQIKKKLARAEVVVPKQGDKKELLDLAMINLENTFRKDELSLKDLQTKLRLQALPNVIECFDISNISGTHSVGSMVQFRGGKPDKRNYRRFKITSVEGQDDFRMIAEVVRRRYRRLISENIQMPDLIVIDGGKGQLGAALEELKQLGLKIPIVSLAKKFEEVYVPGRRVPFVFDRKSYGLKLLQRARDEAHRFAITYHRLLRRKALKRS